jgi:NADH-quinone oxidoreductase subunit H
MDFLIMSGKAVVAWIFPVMLFPAVVYLERKASAFMQDRIGPNRAQILGIRLGGLIHPLADVVKLLFKEELMPRAAHPRYFFVAPALMLGVALCLFAAIPLADVVDLPGGKSIAMQVADLNVGILYIFAISSLAVYGVVLAGWSSNNKWSFLGGLRSSAQMISYEIPLALSVIGLLMVLGTIHLNELVRAQGESFFWIIPKWGIFVQPLGFLLFMVSALAETNRVPFDLPEGESEIVAGYHTEYSSMRFALFFMAEGVSLVVVSSLLVTLFLGGWQVPGLTTAELRAGAPGLLRIGLVGLLVGGLVSAGLLTRFHLNNRRRWGDSRDREGVVLLTLAGIGILALAVALAVYRPENMPDWGPPVFAAAAQAGAFVTKLCVVIFCFVWVRWTLPRFRYDQLMDMGWKNLLPLCLFNILITGVVILLLGGE